MEFSAAVVYGAAAFISLLFYYLIRLRSADPTLRAPPEAGGAWPFLGHLHLISGGPSSGLPHVNLGALADKHGPIFTIRIGVHRAAVVSSWELAKQAFTANDAAVSSRPSVKAGKHLGYGYAMLGFAEHGAHWRQLRKLASAELFSARRLEQQRRVRVAETLIFVGELHALWQRERGAAVDVKERLGELNLNVMLRLVAGKELRGGEEARRCRRVMRDFFHMAGLFVPSDAFPYLEWLDIGGHERRMKRAAEEMDEIVGEWLAEHRRKEYSGEDKAQDFMDVMLSVVKGEDFGSEYDVDTIIKATCGTLIAGGTDTTSVVFIWAIALLLNNRRVLEKAQEELDKHVGKERRVEESDIANLVYLQAIVKETLRLYPPGPLGGARRVTQDCSIGGYNIPKGTWLIVNLWKLHRDPRVWQDPSEFRPERFLNGESNADVKGQDFELIPFGAGRRICPGINFGVQMLHLVLASLLQAFDLNTVSDEGVDMSESAGLTNIKATPLDVVIAPRLPPNLYESFN
uniref:Flavonoid-6-hydroxylase n=1 Tax=Salvia miltiorrhiza TaxID=226208 RepID=A0A0B4VSG1_SALMI|nr:cytochrome P450 CYP82D71 [Salvia miltiorrhiza]